MNYFHLHTENDIMIAEPQGVPDIKQRIETDMVMALVSVNTG